MRPEKITKLMLFLQDKEPLIYMFLLNSKFVLAEEGLLLGPIGVAPNGSNGFLVVYRNDFLEYTIGEIYFMLVHEAQHVLKRHLSMFKKEIKEDENNMIIANIATDAVINKEISEYNFNYITEILNSKVDMKNKIMPDNEFYRYLRNSGINSEEGLTSKRYYKWLKSVQKEISEKIKDGKVVVSIKQKNNENIRMTNPPKEYEIFDDNQVARKMALQEQQEQQEEQEEQEKGEEQNAQEGQVKQNFDVSLLESSEENFVRKLIKESQKMEQELKEKLAGNFKSNLDKMVEGLWKKEVNWRAELRKNINKYISNNKLSPRKEKSMITYLMNPKSRYGILSRHYLKKQSFLESFIIIAMDTSGSCFFDEGDMKKYFSEIDAIAKEFRVTKKGKVFILQWGSFVADELREYKEGEWKNWTIKSGGGTTPDCIFNYLEKKFDKKNDNCYTFNVDKNIYKISTEKNLPMLVVLTDGYFWSKLRKENLGIYKNNHNKILFFTKTNKYIFKEARVITY